MAEININVGGEGIKSKFMTLGMKDFAWGLFYAIFPVVIPLGVASSQGLSGMVFSWVYYHCVFGHSALSCGAVCSNQNTIGLSTIST